MNGPKVNHEKHCDADDGLKRRLRREREEQAASKGGFLFRCVTCSKTFKSRPKLELHMHSHSDSRETICDLCGLGGGDSVLFWPGNCPRLQFKKYLSCLLTQVTFSQKRSRG